MDEICLTPADLANGTSERSVLLYAEAEPEPFAGWWRVWEENEQTSPHISLHISEIAALPPVAARDRRIAELEAQVTAMVKAMDEIRSLANDAQSDEIYDEFTWIIEKIDFALPAVEG